MPHRGCGLIRGLVSTWYVPSYLPTPPEGALTLVLLCLPHAAASQENDNRAQRKDYTGKVLTNIWFLWAKIIKKKDVAIWPTVRR